MSKELMNCDDYLEVLWNTNEFHSLISECYWSGGVNTGLMFDYMIKQAEANSIELIDKDTWDYDTAMYESYKCSDDKGLT